MSDIEDLNKTLYDMGAQDLLDVWNAMETEVGPKKVLLSIIDQFPCSEHQIELIIAQL